MPRDSSGVYTRTNGVFSGSTTWAQQAASADKVISSGRHDTHDQDVADALSASLDRSGKGAMQSNLDLANFKIVNLAAATLGSDAARLDQVVTVVVDDTSPQLGGDLDVNGFSIVSATTDQNIPITPNGAGRVVLDGLSYPDADGTAGQVIETDGAGLLSFTDPPVIGQIQSATKTDTFSTSSTSFVDITGLSVTITPSSATAKILIGGFGMISVSPNARRVFVRLMRDSTPIAIGDPAGSRVQSTADMVENSANYYTSSQISLAWPDEPNTISPVTYKLQMRTSDAGAPAHLNRTGNDNDSTMHPRGAAALVVQEVA